MFKVNALGKVCPLPVIETKKALKNHDIVETIVDNEIAVQNLKKMAEQLDYRYQMQQKDAQSYSVIISKENALIMKASEPEISRAEDYIVVIDTDAIGQGAKELGQQLLKMFIFSLTEQEVLPTKLIFYNGGVHSIAEGSDSLEDLQLLSEKGVEIYACGACLNYYELTDKLQIGEVSNMYHIVEMMRQTKKIIKP